MRTTPLRGAMLSAALLLAALLAGCAAEQLHRQGLKSIEQGNYEQGVQELADASSRAPDNMTYKLDYLSRRESAVMKLIEAADAARSGGELAAAAAGYRRVLDIEPANTRALNGLAGLDAGRRHADAVSAAQKEFERKDLDAAQANVQSVLAEDPGFRTAVALNDKINLARGPSTLIPKLKPRNDTKVTLQFRDAPTKMVFEVLSRQTGINFILDKDVKSDGKTTIYVQDVPIEQAIDLVLDQNSLARQILSSNMVLIYPNTAAKQKDYEQQVVRAFYVTNAAPKDIESMLKTVLGAKTLYVDERSNMVVMRDTPDAISMAEKLVESADQPESEVMLEVQVLEISRSRLMNLGISYPSSITATAVSPEGASGLIASDLTRLNPGASTITPLSVTLNAMETAGLTNTLASPRIRTRNKEKAKILIGSRVPVITNSVTPTASGSPVVTGTVQYLDVGLKVEVQPTIRLDGAVAIKISLEVSTITNQITTSSGTVAYTIGTRNADTLLELKDGETQILAGLIQDSDTRSANNIPGLGDIPIIGRLFGAQNTDREKNEIVLSITPRIIRAQTRPSSDVTEFWFGSESRTMTSPFGQPLNESYAPAPAAAAPALGARTAPVMPGPAAVSGGSSSGGSAAAGTVSASGVKVGTAASAAATVAAIKSAAGQAPAGPPPKLGVSVDGPAQVSVAQEFDVNVRFSSDQAVTHLHSQVRFDPQAVQLISATTGDMVPASAGSPTVDERSGGAQLDVSSTEDPISGEGNLMVLRFKALGPRAASAVAAQVSVLGAGGVPGTTATATPLNLLIQPPQ